MVTPLPWRGGVQPDLRNDGRALRVSAHPDQGLMSISLWRDDVCIGSHQMSAGDASLLIGLLANSLGALMDATSEDSAAAG